MLKQTANDGKFMEIYSYTHSPDAMRYDDCVLHTTTTMNIDVISAKIGMSSHSIVRIRAKK